jgi:hypothetical protein
VSTGRKRGRPRVPDPQERLSTRLPSSRYDLLVKEAARQDQSMSGLVRQILMAQSFIRAPKFPS